MFRQMFGGTPPWQEYANLPTIGTDSRTSWKVLWATRLEPKCGTTNQPSSPFWLVKFTNFPPIPVQGSSERWESRARQARFRPGGHQRSPAPKLCVHQNIVDLWDFKIYGRKPLDVWDWKMRHRKLSVFLLQFKDPNSGHSRIEIVKMDPWSMKSSKL